MSLADHYQASVADIIDFLTTNSEDGLFESFDARFGPANSEWDSVCWFHLTRVPADTDFSEGILPLHLALDKIWATMAAIVSPIQKTNLENLKAMGVPDDLYKLNIGNMSCFAGPNAMLVGDSDEGDRWFRTDGDQRSGIDVISRRSEATLANGFCRK